MSGKIGPLESAVANLGYVLSSVFSSSASPNQPAPAAPAASAPTAPGVAPRTATLDEFCATTAANPNPSNRDAQRAMQLCR